MFEIQGLLVKLNKLEVPFPIVEIVLDLRPLLEQVVQVVRHKQESGNHIDLRDGVLREHQDLVSDS